MKAFLEWCFCLKKNKTTLQREVIAGLTSFSTIAYALILIPSLLATSGINFGAALTATSLVAAFGSLFMGSLANYPFIVAPGVALSAYFSQFVIQQNISWQTGLGVVAFCGVILLILTLLNVRGTIIKSFPLCIRVGVTSGVGLFLALIGLKNAGLIHGDPKGLLVLTNLASHESLLVIFGLIIIGFFLSFRISGALFIGIIAVWVLSLIFHWTKFSGIFSFPDSLSPTFLKLDIKGASTQFSMIVSLVFLMLFDSAAAIVSLAEQGGFLKEHPKKGVHFPRLKHALFPDPISTILGALLGTTSVTVYLESSAGISSGGKTGLTAVVTGLLCLSAIFVTPFAASIPFQATAAALLIVAGFMLSQLKRLDWENPTEWIPSIATLLFIPLSGNIATGVGVGLILYPILKILNGKAKEVGWVCYILGIFFLGKFIFFPNS